MINHGNCLFKSGHKIIYQFKMPMLVIFSTVSINANRCKSMIYDVKSFQRVSSIWDVKPRYFPDCPNKLWSPIPGQNIKIPIQPPVKIFNRQISSNREFFRVNGKALIFTFFQFKCLQYSINVSFHICTCVYMYTSIKKMQNFSSAPRTTAKVLRRL